jgi:hypothetical protein
VEMSTPTLSGDAGPAPASSPPSPCHAARTALNVGSDVMTAPHDADSSARDAARATRWEGGTEAMKASTADGSVSSTRSAWPRSARRRARRAPI